MKSTLLFVVLTAAAAAQNGTPAFEVASVRENRTGDGSSNSARVAGNRYTATNVTLVQLLRAAYGVQEFQIAGQPRWAEVDRFDIDARIEQGARLTDWPLMLQALLAERFKLAFHREERTASVYALVVAKGGPKLTAADKSRCPAANGCGFDATPTQIVGTSVAMPQLAIRLSRSIGTIVIDRTGLPGLFDLTLEWPADDRFVGRGASANPAIFTAIQEQLGLRLEPSKAPVETLVIDRAERPTGN